MTVHHAAPWHRASYDHFLHQRLPQLLADRIPLAGYQVQALDEATCRVTILVASAAEDIAVQYDLPLPDSDGLFRLDGQKVLVVPVTHSGDLDRADVLSVGEQ